MKALMWLILGLICGAGGFHLWYLHLPVEKRCAWDHPLDDKMRAACSSAGLPGYSKASRHELDELVKDVGK